VFQQQFEILDSAVHYVIKYSGTKGKDSKVIILWVWNAEVINPEVGQ